MAKEAAWKDISVVILGRTIEGIVEVKYKRTAKKERLYGRSSKARALLTGNEEISGSITVHQSELQAMIDAAKAAGRSITEISFDIVHAYETSAGVIATDIVVGAEFEEYEKAMAQGDTHMKITLPYQALDLKENV